ncbi:MAG: TerB family tellurite resistance protein, partial [Bdellovibrionales bacterium]|nr:TerB family tellurite resistance protein [Bdellovibrionales bacterium]
QVLSKAFKLKEDDAIQLVDVAQKVSACDQVDELVHSINEHFSEKQKQQVLDLAIEVAQVDGALKSTEVEFVDRLKELLGLADQE